MNKRILYILVAIELILYLVFRSSILSFFESIFPNTKDIEVNIYSSLILIVIGIINIWLVNLIYSVYRINKPDTKLIQSKLDSMRNWILSSKTYWSPKKNDENRKIANTVEGLFMFLYKNGKLNSRESKILADAYGFIIDNIDSKGLPSLSIKLHTVHCTAFGLFIIQKLKEKNLISHSIEQENKINKLIQSLLVRSYNRLGWGFITERNVTDEEIRIPFTFWTLRALNLTNYYNHKIISDILNSLISAIPTCKFGFKISGNPKICSISLFLILIDELRNTELKQEILNEIEIKPLLNLILNEINDNTYIEFEEYDIKRHNLGGVEKLSWNHISIGYAIHALSIYYEHLTVFQKVRLNSIVKRIIRKNIHVNGFFMTSQINIDINNPLIYPTAYLVEGFFYYTINCLKKKKDERN